jgi:DNA-binding response OmpR family regulator
LHSCKSWRIYFKETDIEKGLSLGADAYLTKPFSIKKVVEKVTELLQQ